MNQKGKPVQLFKIYASQSNCRDRVLSGSYMALINGTLAKGNFVKLQGSVMCTSPMKNFCNPAA